LSIFIYK